MSISASIRSLFLHSLDRLGRKRLIFNRDESATYIERYYLLFPRSWEGDHLPFNVYLHHICLSDEPNLHDHPWHWASFILAGGYWETTPEGKYWRPPGYFRRRSMLALHRLEVDLAKAGSETWTLFFTGKRERDWGFINDQGEWVQWHQHLYGTPDPSLTTV